MVVVELEEVVEEDVDELDVEVEEVLVEEDVVELEEVVEETQTPPWQSPDKHSEPFIQVAPSDFCWANATADMENETTKKTATAISAKFLHPMGFYLLGVVYKYLVSIVLTYK